jgi:hypothetical protein
LFCSNSDKSRHVKRELILSDSAGRPIIPLRLEAIDPGDLAYHLADSQWIDCIDRREAVMDRVAAQARLFANVPPELAADVTTLGAEAVEKPGHSMNLNWLLAAAAAVILALIVLLLFTTRAGREPSSEPLQAENMAGSEPVAAPEEGNVTEPPSKSGGGDNEAPAPAPARPAVVAQPAPKLDAPLTASPPREMTTVTQLPLQRVVQACAGVPTDTEYLICSAPSLSQRAGQIGRLVRQIRLRHQELGQNSRAFDSEQRQWFNEVKASCHSAACVEAAQNARLRVLNVALGALD